MRSSHALIVSVSFAVLATCGLAVAQEAGRPAVQVVIGADGSVKVIDPKTGKEMPSVVTRVQSNPGVVVPAAALEKSVKDLMLTLQLRNDQARAKATEAKKEKAAVPPNRFQIAPEGGKGERKIVITEKKIVQTKPEAPAGLEGKIDRLLAEMAELRKDVNQLKSKIDGKQPAFRWEQQFFPAPGKDSKPGGFRFLPRPTVGGIAIEIENIDKAIMKELEALLKKAKMQEDAGRAKKTPERPKATPSAVEERLERILREAEELRREIRKSKSNPK